MSLKFKKNGAFEVEDQAEEFPVLFVLNYDEEYKMRDVFFADVEVGEEWPHKKSKLVLVPVLFVGNFTIKVESASFDSYFFCMVLYNSSTFLALSSLIL